MVASFHGETPAFNLGTGNWFLLPFPSKANRVQLALLQIKRQQLISD